ncbi:uncharacterized protein LACBIDRAFT_312735 [Laccaria bicolor S238N-H82]|uniref:Predicted protein n=1 Tax=Laccaria bicolor (strain S238N-H82 / ATCC MYA-4686) TaxID=486041 RepID=B0DWU4_LACBS|nr:uncharacterized protein LACBIDRAFT_312735 [Laccaria bicolor S238N-H82]EDR00992.1 predicted protein [Laccaria bicolor S238N-H82]|eukprot:XP_001888387.1 predicted protein [Laccaria bicolor S238N-H82]
MERAESKSWVREDLVASSFVRKSRNYHGRMALTAALPSGKQGGLETPFGFCGSPWSNQVVFESPVRSGFLMPRGVNRNRNRSAFSPEVKRPDRTAKRPQTAVFCGL